MNGSTIAVFIQEGTKILSGWLKTRAAGRVVSTPARTEASGQAEASLALGVESGSSSLAEKATDVKSGCIPCSLGHMGTCSGLLNEAMRFARQDGIASDEVTDRLGMCLDEFNALERVDLRPEMIHALPPRDKEIAIAALEQSRATRHSLESVRTVDDLEAVAAQTQTARLRILRDWVKVKTDNLPPEAQEQVRASMERPTKEDQDD